MKKSTNQRTPDAQSEPVKVRFVTVSEDDAGRRLDNYLLMQAAGVPRPRVYRAIRGGEVRVNKGRSTPGYRLACGDVVRIPPFRMAAKSVAAASGDSQSTISRTIVERHKAYYVINKPSGWAVHGGSGVSLGVIETLRQALPHEPYLELAHRLDRETSGCLVIARKRSFLRELHRQIREHEVGKTYLLLVRGHWDYGRYRCELHLHTHHRQGGERYVQVAADGKYCRTDFRPVEFYSGATLLEAQLHTGRTHQIRVHCAQLGHPIAGDERYGDDEFNKAMQRHRLQRLFLHASSFTFEYPEGNPCQISAPLPDDLASVLGGLHTKRRK
ncbi:MAG: RluA family pseudouridine synthase [Gammaproteobacteria bacterium]|nr:RluA family pseudouridine synthase [Gammaproteobacteria bacterium]